MSLPMARNSSGSIPRVVTADVPIRMPEATKGERVSKGTVFLFTVISARPAGSKDVVVRTRIERPSGPPIKADWRVRVIKDEYKIIDVTVEGVSMAITQRSEFAAVIKSSGFEGLLVALRARVEKFSAVAQ